ncbi:hypothetical protein IB024_04990 [Brucella sp. 6810]|uniref:hypothetical protein n=1 Tax=Brucella sp. 6810 TaxID=2769351 RepID=UPI00165B0985|nr:hypothetical protein [Brucella sp. 6810]QNQ63356.1 hypothetical protein IB024_04990 [Brucella sp. 6810]
MDSQYILEDLDLNSAPATQGEPVQLLDILEELDKKIAETEPQPVIFAGEEIFAIGEDSSTARSDFYKSLPENEAEQLQAVAARINHNRTSIKQAILDIGKDLIAIKNSIPGHFDRWLKLEFSWSKSTAWNYINAAQRFGDKPEVFEALPPATIYKLAAKATPEAVRTEIVAEIMSGAPVDAKDVESRIMEAKEEVRAKNEPELETTTVQDADIEIILSDRSIAPEPKPILIDIDGGEDQKRRMDAAREAAKFLRVGLGEKRFKEFMKLIKEADMLEFERQLKKSERRKQTTSEQQMEAMESQPTYGMFS